MVPSRFVLLALALIFFAGGHEASDDGSMVQSAPVRIVEASAASDQAEHSIIVGFDPALAGKALSPATRSALAALRAEITQTLCDGRITIVRLGADVDVQAALARFQALPQVRYATLNHRVTLSEFVPNDPQVSAQWALSSTSSAGIRATLAWDQTTGSATTLVGVMDTGIDYTHADLYLAVPVNNAEIPATLAAQLVDTNGDQLIDFYDLNSLNAAGNVVVDGSGAKFNSHLVADGNGNGYIDAKDLLITPWIDGVDNDGNGRIDDLVGWNFLERNNKPMDTNGHGTHVAGIIGARGNNGIGIAGVNWRVRLLPLRIQSGDGGHAVEAIQAIEYALSRGVKVINSSWGIYASNPALEDAIAWAGEKGAVVVTAAGNGGGNLDTGQATFYPAQYQLPNLISVASVESNGTLTSDSNYGINSIAMAAPGVNILSTVPGGGYALKTGTSMAVPHVTGVVSLLAGLFPNEPPAWLVDRVLSTARPLPSLSGKVATGGIVDAFAAVNTPNVAGPRIVSATPVGDVAAAVSSVVVTFDRQIAAATFGLGDVTITGPAGAIAPTGVTPLSSLKFEVRFAPQSTLGTYSARVGPAIADLLGRPMDQDRDGVAGESQDDQFALAFREVPVPTIRIIDNGETGFSVTPGWINYPGAGARNDLAYTQAGSGTERARWTFTDLAPGQYRVAVTWMAYSNRPIDARYAVFDGSVLLSTETVNQQVVPASFVEGGIAWQVVGTLSTVTTDTLVVELSNLAASGSYVIADAVRVERVSPLPPGPELQVLVDNVSMADGGSAVNFGRVTPGSTAIRTVTVRNLGTTDLALGTIRVPVGFNLASGFGSSILIPGQFTTFSIQLNTSQENVVTGPLSFDSIDADESPFDMTLTGIVSLYPGPFVIDNGGGGFDATPGWSNYVGAGAQGDFAYKSSGGGSEAATWTLPNLAPGRYRVSVTWEAYWNRPAAAAYTVYDGDTALSTVVVNQQTTPTGFVENGVAWQDLGAPFTVTGNALVVDLSDLVSPSGSYVIADAVRVERVGPLPSGPEIQVFVDGVNLLDGSGTVDFGATVLGTTVSRTIAVRNLGTTDLTMGTFTVPAGFTLVSGFGSTTVAPGQTESFVLRLDAGSEGVVTGVLSLPSDDADENPFDITLSGTVSLYPAPVVIDDGDAGYAATAGWNSYVGVGTQNDFSYKAAGNGSEAATWSLAGLAPGLYRVSITWEPYSNRSVDAPFAVYDGTFLLGTARVNQQAVPGSFVEGGTRWYDLRIIQSRRRYARCSVERLGDSGLVFDRGRGQN